MGPLPRHHLAAQVALDAISQFEVDKNNKVQQLEVALTRLRQEHEGCAVRL